jgi:putative endonuclease
LRGGEIIGGYPLVKDIHSKNSVILSGGEPRDAFFLKTSRAAVEGPSRDHPKIMKTGYVYILSSHSRRLYIGVTSDLEGRIWEHKEGTLAGFTKTYKINQLVYYEDFPDMLSAIAWEKRLKGWTRAKKIAPILKQNPGWEELSLS